MGRWVGVRGGGLQRAWMAGGTTESVGRDVMSQRKPGRRLAPLTAPPAHSQLEVESSYRDVAYHNAMHGSCVTHGLHWLLTSSDTLASCISTPLEVFACLLAAIVHDLNHDGRNNAFRSARRLPTRCVTLSNPMCNAFQPDV